jgi:hypothetical protein
MRKRKQEGAEGEGQTAGNSQKGKVLLNSFCLNLLFC